MSKIIKTTQGEAHFVVKEEYPDENAAIAGNEPTTQEADIQELKIENVKYKLKEVITNE
ncbi:hypothetical protein N8707_01380 [Candidatus Pelagibacter sp.]|nr:hypothetical protein [Candidatus Pelagibacter sp.]